MVLKIVLFWFRHSPCLKDFVFSQQIWFDSFINHVCTLWTEPNFASCSLVLWTIEMQFIYKNIGWTQFLHYHSGPIDTNGFIGCQCVFLEIFFLNVQFHNLLCRNSKTDYSSNSYFDFWMLKYSHEWIQISVLIGQKFFRILTCWVS